MTTNRIDAIRKRRAAITPGPWRQGATLLTPQTRRWSKEEWDENERRERRWVFAYFSTTDSGRTRTPICETRPETEGANAEFIASAPSDIDYLLSELEASKENADHLRKSCEMLSESVLKLADEVERLRAENLNLGRTLQEVYVTYAPETEPEREVYRLVAEAIGVSNPMQQLTDLSQELGLYDDEPETDA